MSTKRSICYRVILENNSTVFWFCGRDVGDRGRRFLFNGCYKTFKCECSAVFFGVCFSLLMGVTPSHNTLGRFLSTVKIWKQEDNFGALPAKKYPHKLSVCCSIITPMFTLERNMGWGRERVVRLATYTDLDWPLLQGDKPSMACTRKGAAHPALS